MTTTRHTTRTLVLAATAITALGVVTPAQTASAQPKEQHAVTAAQHRGTSGCADQLRDLTVEFRNIGMTGQASHIAAQLTLGC